MRHSRHSWAIVGATAIAGAFYSIVWAAGAAAPATPDEAAGGAFFEKEVRPLLAAHCLKCHGADDKIKGGLRLTSREDLLRGGDLGSVIDLANRPASLLLRAIHYQDDKLQMPPKGKLPPEAV